MSYYVQVVDGGFTIKEENVKGAMDALTRLNGDIEYGVDSMEDIVLSDGSRIVPNGAIKWLPYDFPLRLSGLAEVLETLGFLVDAIDGDLEIFGYDGKTGDEMDVLSAMAPFIEEGGYLVWEGEDENIFREDSFDGKKMTSSYGSL